MHLYNDFSFFQLCKENENVSGDVMQYKRLDGQGKLIGVLSDGLGSGIKANISATLTASMAMRFMEENKNLLDFVDILISSLPLCNIRKLSYATFSLIEIIDNRKVKIAEMGNPKFLLFRNKKPLHISPKILSSDRWEKREILLYEFELSVEDRIIIFSDGVYQPGITSSFNCVGYIENILEADSAIDSHSLAKKIVYASRNNIENGTVDDDITCSVFHIRQPKNLLIVTGPPYSPSDDQVFAEKVKNYKGGKIICGGVTAKIIAREMNLDLSLDTSSSLNYYPPIYKMRDFEMVTEGAVTLTELIAVLKDNKDLKRNHPVMLFAEKLKQVDIVDFLVGTKVNEAHMTPSFPIDMDIRRNIVKKIAAILREKYLKEINISFIQEPNIMKKVPEPTLRRLPMYLSMIDSLAINQNTNVSTTYFADKLNIQSIQVRKDLAVTGIVGKPKLGYDIVLLRKSLRDFLGWDDTNNAFLIGAGNLGKALIKHHGFKDLGLIVLAAFDVNEEIIGSNIAGIKILTLSKLSGLIKRMHVNIGILTVPEHSAKPVADIMIKAGIAAIWNFTGIKLIVPDDVIVEDVSLNSSLSILKKRLKTRQEKLYGHQNHSRSFIYSFKNS